ncbi:COMM domain-containing protein 4 isoform X2 [Copidosoma floridanum]|nr:COMM domain-containing protein 4 isoform X2 [Copidosoma floridanum]
MPSSKMKSLSQIVIKAIISKEIDQEKMKKFSQESKIELDNVKALIAALDMIFKSSSRNSVSPADLSSELQQLGLPREHSTIVSRLHTDNCAQITVLLTEQSLRINRVSSIEIVPAENSPSAKMILKTVHTPGDNEHETLINIPKEKLSYLLGELKNVRSLMEQLVE